MVRKFVFAASLVSVAGVASAHHIVEKMICPELDPASLMSGLSLLAAGLMVWRGKKA